MSIETTSSPATAARPGLPEGITVQPRRFEFRDLDAVPQYWFGGNPLITHAENTFSILIPPGELFFIRSVRNYADQVRDPELASQVRAFIQQEGFHTRAHNEFNASLERFGIDVDREIRRAEKTISLLERMLPKKMQLGATVFLEHLTATGAHMLFAEPTIADEIHPEALRFWRWHAAEELEHKAVAFDVFQLVGGGYLTRVLSALAALVLLSLPFDRSMRRMMRDDRNPITAEHRAHARAINRKLMGPQVRMIARYFKPGFHPWQQDDAPLLKEWYATA